MFLILLSVKRTTGFLMIKFCGIKVSNILWSFPLLIYSNRVSSLSDLFSKFNKKLILALKDGMKGSYKQERKRIKLRVTKKTTSDLAIKKCKIKFSLILPFRFQICLLPRSIILEIFIAVGTDFSC